MVRADSRDFSGISIAIPFRGSGHRVRGLVAIGSSRHSGRVEAIFDSDGVSQNVHLLASRVGRVFRLRTGRPVRRRALAFEAGTLEGLEQRLAMSASTAAAPAIQMISATTTDSKSVTIDYTVNQTPDAATPLQFGIYRSSTGSPLRAIRWWRRSRWPRRIGVGTGRDKLDQNGQPATAVGTHQVTLPLAQGLPPFPEKPYVLVVADPNSPSATADPRRPRRFESTRSAS